MASSMEQPRQLSVDVFRGLAIVFMVFGNTSLMLGNAPWAAHAEDFGLTPGDLVAPMFVFAIATTYKLSFQQRLQRHGALNTYACFLRRYTCLVGIGFLFHPVFPASAQGVLFGWGTLAAIGFAGLLSLAFVRLPRLARLVVALASLAAYQALLAVPIETAAGPTPVADINLSDNHGGLFGGLGWFAMMLLATAVVDDVRELRPARLLSYGLALCLAGAALHLAWLQWELPAFGGISKQRTTAAFVLVSVGCCSLAFWLVWYLYDARGITGGRSRVLQPLGKNSFLLFLAHPFLVLAAYLLLPGDPPSALVLGASLLNAGLVAWAAVWMNRRGHFLTI